MIFPSLYFIYLPLFFDKKKQKKLQHLGQKETVKILEIEDTGIKVRGKPYKKITVNIMGKSYSFKTLTPEKISTETEIEVLYNPQNPAEIVGNW